MLPRPPENPSVMMKRQQKKNKNQTLEKNQTAQMARNAPLPSRSRNSSANFVVPSHLIFFQRKNETTLPHFSKEYSKTKQLFLLFSRLGGEKKSWKRGAESTLSNISNIRKPNYWMSLRKMVHGIEKWRHAN